MTGKKKSVRGIYQVDNLKELAELSNGGRNHSVNTVFPPILLDQVDQLAEHWGLTVSDVIRHLVSKALPDEMAVMDEHINGNT
jgi:hypothetical protein